MVKRRAWMVGIVVVLVALIGSGFVWYKGRSKPTLQNLATAQAETGSVVVTVSDTGTIASNLQVDVRPQVAGTIATVQTDLGKQVKKGDVLATLSAPDVVDAATQSQLDLQTAQSKLKDMTDPSAASLQVQQATINLQNRAQDVANLTVAAPQGGVVSNLAVQQGDSVSPGQVIGTLVDTAHLQETITVSQDLVGYVKVGQSATVTVYGVGQRTGHVKSIDVEGFAGKNTNYFNVVVALDQATDGIQPGMTGLTVISVQNSALPGDVQGNGTISAASRTDVKAKVAGTVQDLKVTQGDTVTQGQTLVVLSNDSLLLARDQAKSQLDSAQQLLDFASGKSTSATSDIEAQQVRVQELQMTAASRQRDLDSLTIRAPLDGVVTARNANVGDKVSASGGAAGVLFSVADYSKMQITMSVDELDVGKVQVGQKGRVTIDALPGKNYNAEVVSIAPSGTQAQGVATFPVVLSLDNPGEVKAGMTANVEIMVARKDNTLVVPLEAVQKRGARGIVRKLVNGQVVATPVETGLANDTVIEITSGLQAGDTVVTGSSTSQQAGLNGLRFGGGLMGGGADRGGTGGGNYRPSGGTGGSGGNRTSTSRN